MIRAMPIYAMALLLLGLSGCGSANVDPINAPGSWRAADTNDINLRAMLANPDDFFSGVSDPGSRASSANDAVFRLLTDKVKALPVVSGVTFGGGAAGAAGGGATRGASPGGGGTGAQ
jgi:hypothetical protein